MGICYLPSLPLPSFFFPSLASTIGVALGRQTNRQIKRVGGLLPGGRGLFKRIDRDSYAKVIKQLLVCAILGLERRVMLSQPSLFFFKSNKLCELKEMGVPQCLVCGSYLSILHIRIPPRFPLKMQKPALPSR